MDTNKRRLSGKRADKVKLSVSPTTMEPIQKKRQPMYFPIDEDIVAKKCFLKKKATNNSDKQKEDGKIASHVDNVINEDSLGRMEAFMNLHSYASIRDIDELCANSDEEVIRDIGYDCLENLRNPLHTTVSNKMKEDSNELELLKKELEKEKEARAALEELLEKEKQEKALLQDALEKEKSSKSELEMALEKEKMSRIALEDTLDNDKLSTAAAKKALDQEKSAAAALEKTLQKKRADNAALQKSLQKRKDIISGLTASLAEEKLKVETLASELKSCEKVKKQLRRHLARSELKLEEQADAKDKMAQEKDMEIQQLQDHVIELQKRHLSKNATQIQVQKLQQEVRVKDQQLLSLKTKAKQMSEDLVAEKDKSLRLQMDIAEAQSQQRNAEDKSICLTHDSKDIKSSLVAQKAVVTKLQQRLETEMKNASALRKQVLTLEEAVREKDELLALKDRRINQLRSKLIN